MLAPRSPTPQSAALSGKAPQGLAKSPWTENARYWTDISRSLPLGHPVPKDGLCRLGGSRRRHT